MFGKLLCAVTFASAAFARGITIALPAEGTKVQAGSALTVQLERPTSATDSQEIAVAIGGSACLGGCPNDGLYHVLYAGPFNPTSINKAGNVYQNITVTAPNWFDGNMVLSVAHFYLDGTKYTPELQHISTTISIVGSSG